MDILLDGEAWPQFGDDGIFWMSYHDFLIKFELTDRTRLFDEGWTVVQQWISVCVSWVTGYLNTKFVVEVKEGGPTVVVLSQLDTRYFVGSKANTSSSFTSSSKEKASKQTTTSFEPADPTTAAPFPPKSI